MAWFGFGVFNFLLDAKNWIERYEKNPPRQIHHSERLSYFDSFLDGWFLLNCDQRVWLDKDRKSMIHHAEIVIQLPGIPLDLSLLRRFCREINNENAIFYQTAYYKSFCKRLEKPVKLQIVSEVVLARKSSNDSELVVNGVVAKNPFYKKKKLPKELSGSENFIFSKLVNFEYLICAVRDWYDLGDEVDAFDLFELEAMQAGGVFVFRPVCTWRNILEGGKKQKFSSNQPTIKSILEKHSESDAIWDSLKKIKK